MPSHRLQPEDEFTHENTGEANFNESMYFNFYDPQKRLGGFLRIGLRPNEGNAETTVCLFRPDGSVAFDFKRPELEDAERFAAGGVQFDVEKPFERLHIGYTGKASALADPLAMREPRRAFRESPRVAVEVDLAIHALAAPVGGERARAADAPDEMEFARGHYEQHHRAVGRVAVDGEPFEFDGFGLRDHSWGPRSWQAPRFYRWLTANFGPDLGFACAWIARPDGGEIRGGFVHRGRRVERIRDVTIDTDFAGPERLHQRLRVRLAGDGEPLSVEGRVLSMIPLRNRRAGRTTRISEGMTEWTCAGRTGYGLSEYLDQID